MADMIKAATPVMTIVVVCAAICGLAAIGAGIYLVGLGTGGATSIHILGASIDTQSVGVACVFLGIVSILAAGRYALKTIQIISKI